MLGKEYSNRTKKKKEYPKKERKKMHPEIESSDNSPYVDRCVRVRVAICILF